MKTWCGLVVMLGLLAGALAFGPSCYDTTIPAPKGPPGTNPADYPPLTDAKNHHDAGADQ